MGWWRRLTVTALGIGTVLLWGGLSLAGSTPVGQTPQAVPRTNMLHLVIGLKLPQPAAAQAMARAVRAGKARPLSVQDFTDTYGPTTDTYNQVVSYLEDHGFQVEHTYPNRLLIDVEVPAGVAEDTFGVSLNQTPDAKTGKMAMVPSGQPVIPGAIRNEVESVIGLNTAHHLRNHLQTAPVPHTTAPHSTYFYGYTPTQIAQAYNLGPVYQQTEGAGQTVDIITAGDYLPSDISYYDSYFSLPIPTNAPPVVETTFGTPQTDSGSEGETTLDIERVQGTAPAAQVHVYASANDDADWIDAYGHAVTDNRASVMTTSWGMAEQDWDPNTVASEDAIFTEAAAQGISAFAASGDTGAIDDPNNALLANTPTVDFPGSDPNVTDVGGTTLPPDANGNPVITSEVAWGAFNSDGTFSGSGGGQSVLFNKPSWQTGGPRDGVRDVPDVALDADANTGYQTYYAGSWYRDGGTSAAAPTMAGITALLDAEQGTRLGCLNPWLYTIASNASLRSSTFNDITSGGNDGYNAVTGYDLVTGWGSVNGGGLLTDLTAAAPTSPGPASQLVWLGQPGGSPGGQSLNPQPTLALADANGNVEWNDNTDTVTVSLTTSNGASLGGHTTVTFVNGLANFTDLSVDTPGTYTLTPSANLSNISSPASAYFTITASPSVTIQSIIPSSALAGQASYYTIDFTTSSAGALTTSDSITLKMGPSTTLSNGVNPQTHTEQDTLGGTPLPAANVQFIPSNTGNNLVITPANSISASTAVSLVVYGAINPAAGTYHASLSTTKDTTPVKASYTINAAPLQVTTTSGFVLSPYIPGEALSVSATVHDSDSTATSVSGSVYYGSGNSLSYAPLTPSPNTKLGTGYYNVQATIPAVTQSGLGLFLRLQDNATTPNNFQTPLMFVGMPGNGSVQFGGPPNFPPYKAGQTLTLTGLLNDNHSVVGVATYTPIGDSNPDSDFQTADISISPTSIQNQYSYSLTLPGTEVLPSGLNITATFQDSSGGVLGTFGFPLGGMSGGALSMSGPPTFSPYTVGSSFTVTGSVSDANPSPTVTGAIYYQPVPPPGTTPSGQFNFVPITVTGTTSPYSFNGSVPASAVTSAGLNFYLQFNDSAGATLDTPMSMVGASQTGGTAPVTAQPQNPTAEQTSMYNLGFQIQNNLASTDEIRLTFPSGFTVTGASVPSFYSQQMAGQPGYMPFASTSNNGSGDGNPAYGTDSSNNPTVTLTVGGSVTAPTYLNFPLQGIRNSSTYNPTTPYTVSITTLQSDGAPIEGPYTSGPFSLVPGGPAFITGAVYDASSHNPLQGVAVSLGSPNGPLGTATTDANGAFKFSNLNEGQYFIFTSQTVLGGTYQGLLNPVSVDVADDTTAADVTGINVYLPSLASLTSLPLSINWPATLATSTTVGVFANGPNYFNYTNVPIGGANPNPVTTSIKVPNNGGFMIGIGPAFPTDPNVPPPLPPSGISFPQPVMVQMNSGITTPSTVDLSVYAAAYNIIGTVEDSKGNGISNANVFAVNPAGTGTGNFGMTDGSGHFSLSVPAGTFSVGAGGPGLPPIPDVTVTVSIYGQQTPSALVLKAPAAAQTISGEVTDSGGHPLSGANVFAYPVDSSGNPLPGGSGDNTNASGDYTIDVSAGTWMVGAFDPAYGPLPPTPVQVTNSNVTQNLTYQNHNPATIQGQATDTGGHPLAGVNVFAQGKDALGNPVGNGTSTDLSGDYTLQLPAGPTYTVAAFGSRIGQLPPLTVATSSTGGTYPDENFTAPLTGQITVQLSDTVGQGFASATPTVAGATYLGNGVPIQNQSSVNIPVPYGSYTVQVYVQGQGMVTDPNPVTVASNTPVPVNITLTATETVSGEVYDATTNTGIPGALVTLSNTATGASFIATTDANGNYSLQVAGSTNTYILVADAPGYLPSKPQTQGTNSNNIGLTQTSITVTGTVFLPSGAPLAGKGFVVATTSGLPPVPVPVQSDGTYSLSLGSGTWSIQALANGYKSTAVSENLSSNIPLNLTLSAVSKAGAAAETTMNAGDGGTIQDPNSGTQIGFPAGALGSGTTLVQVSVQATTGAPPSDNGTIMDAVDIEASSNGQAVKNLDGSITIRIPYDPSTVTDPTKLVIEYYNTATGTWVSIPTTVDQVDHVLIGMADHLTTYAVNSPPGNTIVTITPSYGGGGGGGGGGSLTTNTSVQGSIGAFGGSLATADNSFALQIPGGAFSQAATVNIQGAAATAAPNSGFVAASLQWNVSAGSTEPTTPVTATFHYTATALNGLSPNRLGVYYLDPTSNTWSWIGGKVDPGKGTVTALLPHFSTYAVFANTNTFKDLDNAAWAKDSIDTLLGADILDGISPGTFEPSGTLTRAQFTKLLVLAAGLTPTTGATSSFSDVAGDAWYAPYVAAAVQAGLVQGTSATTFTPEGAITREQMAVMLARLLGTANSANPVSFTDSNDISSWALSGVQAAVQVGLIQGFPDGTFQPGGTATRAQAAEVVAKYLKHAGKI